MIADQARFERAIASFDAHNSQDPKHEQVHGREVPRELLYAERMTAMLARYQPEASEPLLLAARCQHIQRWEIARDSYPMTRPGYHQWRNRLKQFHAEVAAQIMQAVGYDQASIDQVGRLLRKEGLHSDPDMQTLEDVIVMVFVEHYLVQFVEEHSDYDEAKFLDILRKSLRKMSARGREQGLALVNAPVALLPLLQTLLQEDFS